MISFVLRLLSLVLTALLSFDLLVAAEEEGFTPGAAVPGDYSGYARMFLQDHCVDCHGDSDPEGDLSLTKIGAADEINAATWRSIWAQVTLREMPPKDGEQPEVIERLRFSDWIVGELTEVMRDKGGFREHLDPSKGNFVDHDLLFGPLPKGIHLVPTSTPARMWRVTREEHITRLNELINTEPAFDLEKPGLRARGDAVPTNHGGELKLYFGTDRIIQWQGGTVAYATAVKSLPAVLSTARDHGLENYPDLYTVNSAEATQILDVADDLIRYMAYGPLSIAEPWQITDEPKSVADKMKGDIRGLPTSIVYNTQVVRPITPVYELMKEEGVTEDRLRVAVDFLFEALTFRPPSKAESGQYVAIAKESIDRLGKEEGTVLGLSAIFLEPDALFRPELVEVGEPDEHGRVLLRDWELGLAVNHALRYIQPDEQLRSAIVEGRMRTREDVRREVERMLADDSIRKPRVLQFFRDYFDYDLGGYICKDANALAATGVSNRGTAHYKSMFDAVASTERLVELILQEDREVLGQLLTTDKVVAAPNDKVYFGRRNSKAEVLAAVAADKLAKAEAGEDAAAKAALVTAEESLAEIEKYIEQHPEENTAKRKELAEAKRAVAAAKKLLAAKNRNRNSKNFDVTEVKLSGPEIFARVSRRSFGNGTLQPERKLATVPQGQRLGILTHPTWLVSHSDAMDNHAIRRGRWIRERLLGGGIPDVPITVDAMLPDEPHHSLRERMRVTRESYCWNCHQKMDPLGLAFEMYNHAGLFRETELEMPVDSSGEIIDSGDPTLDGKVDNALEMIERLSYAKRVEEVFVRHAFRFWMGRNETLHDGPVLQAAHRAYRENGGSMNALLVSLLTSDAFLYRTREANQ